MLKLPDITLIALTGKDFPAHDEAIKKSCEGIEWGDVKVVYDYKIKNINDWNRKIVYELHKYFDTSHCMLIHPDGYVVNPSIWKQTWLSYDYIGAPWPLPTDSYSYRTSSGKLIRVGNSVGLRSKKLMELPSRLGLEWKSYYGNTNEDGFLAVHHRELFESHGIKYAPIEEAVHFAKEHEIPENVGLQTFAFHTIG